MDEYLAAYTALLQRGWFMPRIYLATEGVGWWGALHPDEMNVLRRLDTGEVAEQDEDNPEVPRYLGHGVRLGQLNTHSFHSTVWRAEAAAAVRALVAHCEAQPYAERIFAWHLCDGLFQEWFHWNEYNLTGMADYSPAAAADFRRWLRVAYQDDVELLADAWGRPVTFEEVAIPAPGAFMQARHGLFYDPATQRDCVDYLQCMSDSIADSIIAVCGAAKAALPQPKVDLRVLWLPVHEHAAPHPQRPFQPAQGARLGHGGHDRQPALVLESRRGRLSPLADGARGHPPRGQAAL